MTLLVCSNMDTKCCGKCNLLLSLDNFSKNKGVYIGTCKKCRNFQKKEWREKNPENVKSSAKSQYEKHKTKKSEYGKKRYLENKEHVLEINNRWKNNNKEKYDQSVKKWQINNPDKIKKASSDHYLRNKDTSEYKERRRNRMKERKKVDINFKISENCRNIVYSALKRKNDKKNERSLELLGCSVDFFMKWIEWNFDSHMSWNNYGIYWEVDHITPISSFDLKLKCQRLLCFNWKNCRPLEKKENNRKKAKIIEREIISQQIKVCYYMRHIQIAGKSLAN